MCLNEAFDWFSIHILYKNNMMPNIDKLKIKYITVIRARQPQGCRLLRL